MTKNDVTRTVVKLLPRHLSLVLIRHDLDIRHARPRNVLAADALQPSLQVVACHNHATLVHVPHQLHVYMYHINSTGTYSTSTPLVHVPHQLNQIKYMYMY